MIKAIVIDDELHAIETLVWKIKNLSENIHIQATFTDPEEGLRYLQSNEIDLLFLDIEMPILGGFDILRRLQPINFDVIFVTAYDEYGIKAIKYSALDYLLKPVQEEDLKIALEKVAKKKKQGLLPAQLEVLLQNMNAMQKESRRIALATKESIELVHPKDIVLCQADNNYTMVFMQGRKKKLISKTLKEFEETLEDHHFFRTHQSYLINLNHIQEYIRKDGGYMVMSNQMKVPIARSKKEELMKFLI
ncbi:MAG: LytTR family DNA-binding domain-containing protein [Bacteroidota bacterium]